MKETRSAVPPQAFRLLSALAALKIPSARAALAAVDPESIAFLLSADLVALDRSGAPRATSAGRAFLARRQASRSGTAVDPFLAQHADPASAVVQRPEGPVAVHLDHAESPLAWLARRKGRDGEPLIRGHQLAAGERLRAEFTRGQMTPRITSNWSAAGASGARGSAGATPTDTVVAARQRVRHALEAVGPEFAGLLLDVCCFLKRLEDVERERRWPARSAKLVLQLGLDRLARHYGLDSQARGRAKAPMRAWTASDGLAGIAEG